MNIIGNLEFTRIKQALFFGFLYHQALYWQTF